MVTFFYSFTSIVTRHAYTPGNLCLDSKNRAIPSLHRDSLLAKVPGHCPVLRQVTQTPHIAGPLGFMLGPTNI